MRVAGVCALLCVSVLAPAQSAKAGYGGASIVEKIEWTWADRPAQADPRLPNVLLIGDSITRGYYPAVAEDLRGKANCYLFATSASSGDPRLLKQVDDYFAMSNVRFAAVHFNNGMHGWGYSEEQYAAGLPSLVAELRHDEPRASLIWASTTPVHAADAGGATNERVDRRNGLAAAVMNHEHISVDDQHALMLLHDDLHNGNVHYTNAGSEMQGTQAAASIARVLADHAKK